MGYTFYEPLKVWLDPASIADVVAYIQTYLTDNPISDEEEIENIVAEYIAAHPELIGGVQSVNGETGEVVLTASDINTSNNTTIQAVLTALSGQISEIVQTITGLDTRVTANATGITNEATARANADTALGNRITALQGAVGSPLVASTAAAMTDTSKIYVYTGSETGYTNGNWYYYNGSAWANGGVYNATAINTDTTLTVAGMAADAKATGDGLNDLKSATQANTDNIDSLKGVQSISIPLPVEVGGFNESGVDIVSTNRARTQKMSISLACPTFRFTSGTRHRFCYMLPDDTLIELASWSTDEVDTIRTTFSEDVSTGLRLRILIRYNDNRRITEENLPVVTCEYTLTNKINGFEGWALSTTVPSQRSIYKSSSTSVFSISPLIPVEYGKTYRTNAVRNLVFYDDTLNGVATIPGGSQPLDLTFTVTNANAKYVMYCYKTNTGDNYFEEADGFIAGNYKDLLPYSLAGKRLSLLGDSISAYSGLIPSGNASYYSGSNHGVIDPAQMWWNVLCAKTGMIPLVINADSGAGVTQLEDSSHSAKVPMSSDAKCSALNNGTVTPDVIVIEGGVNDYTYALSAQSEPLAWNGKTAPVLSNSFTEAYACMIKKLQTNYPNAIIVALSTPFTMRGTDNGYTRTHTVGSNVYTQADYDEAIKNVCEQMHIPYVRIDDIGMNRSNMYPTYAEDSSTTPAHPNAKGQMLLGTQLATRIPIAINGYLNQL